MTIPHTFGVRDGAACRADLFFSIAIHSDMEKDQKRSKNVAAYS